MKSNLRIKKLQKFSGEVLEKLPNAQFMVMLDIGQKLRCYLTGKMKLNKIKVMIGDKVDIELPDIVEGKMENYIGRIIFRRK